MAGVVLLCIVLVAVAPWIKRLATEKHPPTPPRTDQQG
jgi:hypothetical protein